MEEPTGPPPTDAPRNFRDVGDTLKKLSPDSSYLPSGRIFRGGQIDFLPHAALGKPTTIINLRMPKDDATLPHVKYLHFPIANSVEKYDTRDPDVRDWLKSIVKAVEDDNITFPVMIHCFSGKDRTGVVVAALLHILGVPVPLIVKEFLATPEGVKEADIQTTLAELEKKGAAYYRGIKLDKVRAKLRGS